eukprot:CAMPEP_0116129562 /NCGR_PEP_ID=MMETSP0329-20121206/7988_1 /TAXON_ID=697910 /ORGANISM="Pseudo-nitzschia arenysensis, Strain B593" /LENGTH=1052 /DNA_ID=CAMNT_0003623833 /DNA_START=203 /DNA_END=3361 /DNA_ORIENTATION=-
MSTVALRGILAYDETANEWSWKGRWLFGDCVPVPKAGAEGESTALVTSAPRSKQNAKMKDTSQPFLYKWQEASEPSAVPVPSLNVKIIGADDEEEVDEEPEAAPATPMDVEPPTTQRTPEKESIKPQQEQSISLGNDSKSEKPSAVVKDETAKGAEDKVAGETTGRDPSSETKEKTQTTEIDTTKPEQPKPTTAPPAAPMDPKTPSDTTVSDDIMQIDKPKDDKETVPPTTLKVEEKTKAEIEIETATTESAPPPSVPKENEKMAEEKKVDDNEKKTGSLPVVEPSKESAENKVSEVLADGVKEEAVEPKKEEEKSTETTKDTSTPADATTPMDIEPSTDVSKTSKPKPEAPPKVTFADIIPEFLNATDKYSNKDNKKVCPSSGQWKGYFENVIPGKRSGRNKAPQPPTIQRVEENFYLFLNATPSSNEIPEPSSDNPLPDLFAFETTTKDHIPKLDVKAEEVPKDEPKKETTAESTEKNAEVSFTPKNDNTKPKETISLVQVRGCGENEFGTFEIMGYLDLNTMVMEIQRQYVVTELQAVSPAVTRRRRSSATVDSLQEGPRPHSTRKRNPTWKRASYDPEEDRRRKRTRPLPGQKQGSPMSIDANGNLIPVTDANGVPIANSSIPFTINPDQSASSGILLGKFDATASSMLGGSTAGKGQKSRLVLPTQAKAAGGATTNASGRRRSASTGAIRTKRRSSGMGKSGSNAASTKSGSTYIRLPAVGDPKKARWRAAHFLYYQRDDPEQRALLLQQQQQQAGEGANPNGSNGITPNAKLPPPKPKYVIYEGEMVDSKREGRGICLFTDGTFYEGEWKRNKEHGYGKLMSSDRKQIIYEGEWERGRMQGTGTYYYGSSDPLKPGSRYVGEFRENLRNGMGRYFLADGSVYDGQWRDGVMNGLGIFTWPDLSMYDGVWKDGKRNGQGLLKKADGFIYDGQWVNNTMEGRGIAIYPNGQKYEGSFSNGRREGRGTIVFTNGAVYEGRFRDDAVDGQGTMKMSRTMIVPREEADEKIVKKEKKKEGETAEEVKKEDFMIPISFQSDMTRILTKTGFM